MRRPIIGTGRPDSYLLDGRPVPSVTEILGRAKASEQLVAWAARRGARAKSLRDNAGSVGSLIHGAWLLDRWAPCTDDELADLELALPILEEWERASGFHRAILELPLTNRAGWGGTLDVAWAAEEADTDGVLSSVLVVGDLKTGRRVYPDHVAQVAAYAMALEPLLLGSQLPLPTELLKRPQRGIVIRLHRDPKTNRLVEAPLVVTHSHGDAAARYAEKVPFHEVRVLGPSALALGWRYFQAALGLYLRDRELVEGLESGADADLETRLRASLAAE